MFPSGYHGSLARNFASIPSNADGVNYKYGYSYDFDSYLASLGYGTGACASGTAPPASPVGTTATTLITVLAHGISEHATDADGASWWAPSNGFEDGDLCNSYFGVCLYALAHNGVLTRPVVPRHTAGADADGVRPAVLGAEHVERHAGHVCQQLRTDPVAYLVAAATVAAPSVAAPSAVATSVAVPSAAAATAVAAPFAATAVTAPFAATAVAAPSAAAPPKASRSAQPVSRR